MEKRPLFSLAVSFFLGAASAVTGLLHLRIIFIIAAALVLSCFIRKRRALFIIVLAFFLLGALRGGVHDIMRYSARKAALGIQEPVFFGKLESVEEKKNSFAYFTGDVYFSDGEKTRYPGRMVFYLKERLRINYGSIIRVEGEAEEPSERQNEGGYSEAEYLKGKDIGIRLYSPKVTVLKEGGFSLTKAFSDLRERIEGFFVSNLPGEEGGIISAMALGDRNGLSYEARDLFSAAGIAHLLAVSGLHISLVGAFIYKLLRRLSAGFLLSFLIAFPAAYCYALMCGMSISCERALIMFSLSLFSEVCGRTPDMLTNTGLAAFMLIMRNPYCLFDSAFVFSFSAVIIVASAAGPVKTAYDAYLRCRHRYIHSFSPSFFERLISALLFSATLSIGTMPVVAYYFFEIPIYQVFLNLLLIPLMSVLLPAALIAGFFSMKLLLIPVHFILYFYEWISAGSLKLPLSHITAGQPSIIKMICFYILYFFMIRLILKLFERLKKCEDASDSMCLRKREMRAFVPKGAVLVFTLFFSFFGIRPCGDEFDMLYVGQGDGMFFRYGSVSVMIDGGSSSEDMLSKYMLLPFLKSKGVGKVDFWFVSHLDSDHVNGLIDSMKGGYPVGTVILPEKAVRNENYELLQNAAEHDGADIRFMKKGESLFLPDKRCSFTCLFAGTDEYFEEKDINANSMVLLLKDQKHSFSVLLTGDIGTEQEELLLSDGFSKDEIESAESLNTFILKAAHHGSNGSNSESLLSQGFDLCIISAGKKSRYGHPGKETLERLKDADIPYLCTKESGQIKFILDRRGVKASTQIP